MLFDKSLHYVYRIGSDNQYFIYWNGQQWHFEMLAGGVIFDMQSFKDEGTLIDVLTLQGIPLHEFQIDKTGSGKAYSAEIQSKMKKLVAAGISPCAKHGLSAKNDDGTCEACSNSDYPDDFKGTEG